MFCNETIIENNEFLENYTLIYSFIPDQWVGLDTSVSDPDPVGSVSFGRIRIRIRIRKR